MIIVLVGASGSGKSTLEKLICKEFDMNKIISSTTRLMRKNEVNNVDYHFYDENTFNKKLLNNEFIERAVYNSWSYGLEKDSLKDNSVVVLTPSGLRKLIKYNKTLENPFEIVSFYINVDQRSRLIKLLQRGDAIVECYRRSLSDVGQFDDVEEETDYVIKNYEYRFTPEQMLKHVEDGLSAYHEHIVGKILGE